MTDLNKVKDLYDTNINMYGCSPESVGWGTQEKIDLRFKKLFSMIEPAEKFTLNELGSGYGEAVKYAQKNNFLLNYYYGYDISEKMLDAAKQYLAEFDNKELYHESRLNTMADYSIASGIFNVIFDEPVTAWEEHILQTLQNLNEFSAKGFSFNMLTKYVDYKEKNLYYGDPLYFFDYCKKNFSRFVSLLHDYNLYEWTICVKR